MGNVISRLYNFTNDKNNGVPISAEEMDAELNQLVNTMNVVVIQQATAPSSPIAGQLWANTTTGYLEIYRNNAWVIMGPVHIATTAMTTPQNGDFWYNTSTNVMSYYDSTLTVWKPISFYAKGANVVSATTTTLGNDGNVFTITGTTTITSITAKTAGTVVYLIFSGSLILTNGSNLNLNGNFLTQANSTICLFSDGTNWWEINRSPATGPILSLISSGTQSISGATQRTNWTVIKDSGGYWTSNTYTPLVAGYYSVSYFDSLYANTSGGLASIAIYKNGSPYCAVSSTQEFSSQASPYNIQAIVYCNGSTDYIQLFANYSNATASTGGAGYSGVSIQKVY